MSLYCPIKMGNFMSSLGNETLDDLLNTDAVSLSQFNLKSIDLWWKAATRCPN